MPPIFERCILVLSWNRGARRREREMGKFPVKDSVQMHRPRPGTMRHDGKFEARGARELLLPSKLLKTCQTFQKPTTYDALAGFEPNRCGGNGLERHLRVWQVSDSRLLSGWAG
jgi:hypothetical protein